MLRRSPGQTMSVSEFLRAVRRLVVDGMAVMNQKKMHQLPRRRRHVVWIVLFAGKNTDFQAVLERRHRTGRVGDSGRKRECEKDS